MSLIEIQDLYKIFGPNPTQALALLDKEISKDQIMSDTGHAVALQDVSLSIEQGEVFVIMGLSGSGKSTLVRCVNRLIEPTQGEILVEKQDIRAFNEEELRQFRRHKMSMVFQRFALFSHRTILENVAFGLEVQGVEKNKREEQAQTWIDTVGLSGWEDSAPHQLSGGMQQRVGLARALCTDPEILLMDEPFSALDPLIRREMQDELVNLEHELQKTIIFITHDLDEALRLGDRIAILKDGIVVQVGTPEEILLHPANDYVANFTQDVNPLRVLSARGVMTAPDVISLTTDGGIKQALAFMETEKHNSVFVVDENRQAKYLLTVGNAHQALQKGLNDYADLPSNGMVKVTPKTTVDDIVPLLASNELPIAVVDDKNRLLGAITPPDLLAALAGDYN